MHRLPGGELRRKLERVRPNSGPLELFEDEVQEQRRYHKKMVDNGSSGPECREDPEQVVIKRWRERGLCDANGVVPNKWKNAPATEDSKRPESKYDWDVTRPRNHFKYLTGVKEAQIRSICEARKKRLPADVHGRAVDKVRECWCRNGVWDDTWEDKPGRNDSWKHEILFDEFAGLERERKEPGHRDKMPTRSAIRHAELDSQMVSPKKMVHFDDAALEGCPCCSNVEP